MTQIWERLFVGDLADANELVDNNPGGITTVISLSEVAVQTRREDMNYVHLPIEDDMRVPVRQFYCMMDAIRKNIRWGTVLLHCSQGISRAPSMAAAYMDAVGYKHIDAAIEEIRRMRPIIDPSRILLNSVKENLK
jgi:protein-tyrosine phosphatase